MSKKKSKVEKTGTVATVAEIPAEVNFAEVLAEVRRGFADVVDAIGKNSKAIGDVDARLESVRKILFYIPDVARGVELAKAKRAAKVASENGGKAATVAPSAGVVDVSALSPMIGNESEVTK